MTRQFNLLLFLSIFFHLINSYAWAQTNSSISGQVVDSVGAIIAGATVIVVDSAAKEKSATTNEQGDFVINGLAPGKYIVRVTAPKFGIYENPSVEVKTGEKSELTVVLTVDSIKEEVQVNANEGVSTESASNLSATVIKDKELGDLPDDPEELEAYLQALAGPGAGPNGGQLYIDGFSGGRLPPKDAIREIRINSNPFSAEYDRMGLSRIEIFTKPGNDQFHGSASLNYNDATFNSRNPFALNRAPAQIRNFNGYLSGPLKKKKASFFLDVSQNQQDRSSTVIATVLDPSLNIVRLNQDYKVPTRRFSTSPRLDYLINEKNTVTGRYSYSRSDSQNQGVNGFSLLSRAYDSNDSQHNVQLSETAILSARTINETRFQYELNKREQRGDNSIPTINVSNSFTGGGSQIGKSFNETKRWELQNYTTTSFGKNFQHAVKFGIRIRGIKILDHSESGYGGSFNFAGVRDPLTGEILYSSIEQYRQKLLGNTNPIFNPSQFSLVTGNPDAEVSQTDYGVFFTDDWRVRKNLTLSAGLRYENQNNVRDNFNFAPRVGIAWSPLSRNNKPAKTVLRGAIGIFYDRFNENTTLQAHRNDGVSQLRYIVSDSSILGQAIFTNGGVKNAPTAAQLTALIPLSSTPFRISGDLKIPASFQTVFSIERSLPHRTTITGTFFTSNNYHGLRQRNINAPVCPNTQVCPAALTFQQLLPLRPDPTRGNVYQVESSATSNTQQFLVRFSTRFSQHISFNGNYAMSFSRGTTDGFSGANGTSSNLNFPAYSYDLHGEYAPVSSVSRHTLNMSGSIELPFQIRISPNIIASTGRRFNIVTGVDNNRDSIYTERPTYAVLRDRCVTLKLNNDFCNFSGISNFDAVIPRNYGKGHGNFIVNLSLSKSFGFGTAKTPALPAGRQALSRATPAKRNQTTSSSWFNRLYGNERRKPYNFSIGVNIQNLFNKVNLLPPQSNLSSPFFGQTITAGGAFGFYGSSGSYNRRVDLSIRFGF